MIRTVGEDDAVGVGRFDFGSDYLLTGFDFIAVLIGLFAFSQLLSDLRNPETARKALSDQKQIRVAKIEHRRAIANFDQELVCSDQVCPSWNVH